jgi:ribosomal protein S18 acetylase RimI-like enzyme
MYVVRIGPSEAEIGVEAIRLLKSPHGYPVPSADYINRTFSRPHNIFLVAIDGTEPIGYVIAYLIDRIDRDQQMMLLYEIEVRGPHRRRGVGKQLITELKDICREANAMKMWASTSRSNTAANRLYESTGGKPFPEGDEVTFGYSREEFMGAH